MREWQIGDPIGDGNDIGVPDIPYLDYLKDKKEYNEINLVDEFINDMNNAKYEFNNGKEDAAFSSLKIASKEYKRMNNIQKSRIIDDPFNQDWIIDLCCEILNKHEDEYYNAFVIIRDYKLYVNLCLDCDCVYPSHYDYCIKCEKLLEKPYEKKPEEIAEEIRDAMITRVYHMYQIDELVERSLMLMKSNNCKLVEIRDTIYGVDFIFEKEHRYFKTRYECTFIPSGGPRIFGEFAEIHYHERLLENESFQKLIKDTENKTGFKFNRLSGGYGSELDKKTVDFVFNDKITIYVRFDVDNGKNAVYKLDLDNMKLSDDYHVY